MAGFTFYESATDLIEKRGIERPCQDIPAQVKAAPEEAAKNARVTLRTRRVFLPDGRCVVLPTPITRAAYLAALKS